MSGILRNTLRIVGVAKYAPNNSTKYLRSMTLTTNHLNNSLAFQANQISTNFGNIIRTTGNKILSLFAANEEIKKANIVHLKVLLSDGKVRLMTREREKNLIFPSTFSINLNKESIEPSNNKISAEHETSFYLGKWNVSFDGDVLTFKIDDTDETFILRHAVYVEALIGPPKQLKNGGIKLINSGPPISDVTVFPAKLISKSEGSLPLDREFLPVQTMVPLERLESYGNQVCETLKKSKNSEIIDDRPNSFGQMKLKFPMTASLEGSPQEIKIKDTDDTYTVYHTVDIRTSKKLAKNLKNGSADERNERRSKIGILRIELTSGDLILEPRTSSDQCVFMRQEVEIEIDLDSEVPSILINPHVKTYHNI